MTMMDGEGGRVVSYFFVLAIYIIERVWLGIWVLYCADKGLKVLRLRGCILSWQACVCRYYSQCVASCSDLPVIDVFEILHWEEEKTGRES
jgi:hypothetical protein